MIQKLGFVFLVSILSAFSSFAAKTTQTPLTLKRSLDTEPSSLYLAHVADIPSYIIVRDLYQGLVQAAQDGSLLPGVAEKWEIEDDGKLYRFYLRPNAKWSNGDPVTAHDFVFGWQHMVDPKTASVYAYMLYPVLNAERINKGEEKNVSQLGIHAVTDSILEVKLRATTPYFMNVLLHNSFFPFHKQSYEKHGREVSKPGHLISNGAYMLEAWRPNESILITKNPYFYDAEKVQIEKVHFFPSEDQNTTLKKYKAGELDMTFSVSSDRFKDLKDDPILGKDLKVNPYLCTFYYAINLNREPLGKSKELREALSLVVNRELLVEKVIAAGERPAYRLVPPGTANSTQQQMAFKDLTLEQRIERAKKLYAECGYSEKNPLKLTFTYNTSENHKKIGIAIIDMWKQAFPGIQVQMQNMEMKTFLQESNEKKNLEIFRYGWVGDYNDPNAFLDYLVTGAGYNNQAFSSPEYDELVKKASLTNNLLERAELLGKAEKYLLEEHILIPLYHTSTTRLVKPYVNGYELTDTNVLDIFYSKDLSLNR